MLKNFDRFPYSREDRKGSLQYLAYEDEKTAFWRLSLILSLSDNGIVEVKTEIFIE
jgi:hypothetical protein